MAVRIRILFETIASNNSAIALCKTIKLLPHIVYTERVLMGAV